MSVRRSLLAILDQGPCYGYQLRSEFERRTGAISPLNVGQIYNTLDRLERDGLVEKGETDEQGHVFYRITPAGSRDVAAWLASPVGRGAGTRDELAVKIAIGATLPGVDVAQIVRIQRSAARERRDSLRRAQATGASSEGPEALAKAMMLDSTIFSVDAELRWLDSVDERLARHPEHTLALGLATERPRRGRPAQV